MSINKTATCSLDPFGVRRKGSDHIQIPVVFLSCPPRHAKLVSSLSSVPCGVRSFILPSNSSEPRMCKNEFKNRHLLGHQISHKLFFSFVPSMVIQFSEMSSLFEVLRRYLRKKFSRKDFPVRNAPTTEMTATLVPGGTLPKIDDRFSEINAKLSSSPSPVEIIYVHGIIACIRTMQSCLAISVGDRKLRFKKILYSTCNGRAMAILRSFTRKRKVINDYVNNKQPLLALPP